MQDYIESNPKLARRLKALADKMTAKIAAKRNSPIANQNWTRRRAKIAASMARDADAMEQVQCILYALADAHEKGNVPALLAKITSKATIKALLYHTSWPAWENTQRQFQRAELQPDTIQQAHNLLVALAQPPDRSEERKRRELENKARALVGQVPGFFPTPKSIAQQMVAMANIEPDLTVLEPSAGAGAIADVIREEAPDAQLEVIEWSYTLQEVLEVKGHKVIGDDFFTITEGRKWDRIIQNPPFEKLADIDHVKWAYEHLSEGGRLVSVMSESPFFRGDKKAHDFRSWLDEVGGYTESKLDHGTFAGSGTGIAARVVVIDK